MKASPVLVLFVLLSACIAAAQRQTLATKIDEVDKDAVLELFTIRAEAFVKAMESADKDTQGFITIYKNESAALEMDKVFSKEPDLKKRIHLFEPGRIYQGNWKNVEFWLIPPGAEWPFTPTCALCDCPTISVSGPSDYNLSLDSRPVFIASVSGGSQDTIEYFWTVEGGEIETGQGTPSIAVKPKRAENSELKATVEIKGMEPSCNCPNTAFAPEKVSTDGGVDQQAHQHQRPPHPTQP